MYNPIVPNDWKRIRGIKAIREIRHASLRDTLIFIAETFGFEATGDYNHDSPDLSGWRTFMRWQDDNKVSFEMVQGPHAITILKLLAIKHGRNVSTGQ